MMNKEKETITQRKSNKSVKTAVLLFGAVLLTTSLLGGTLAKYVGTIGEASDTARAAKWKVDEKIKTFDLFANSYLDAAGGNTPGSNATATVKGEGTDKVIAPGTKGSAQISVQVDEVTPEEVAYKFVFAVGDDEVSSTYPFYKNGVSGSFSGVGGTYTTPTGWNIAPNAGTNPTEYDAWLPLKFKVSISKDSGSTFQELYDGFTGTDDGATQVKALRNALLGKNKDGNAISGFANGLETDIVYPNDSLTDAKANIGKTIIAIDWEWPFEDSNDSTRDGKDTAVGEQATIGNGNTPNFVIPIKGTKVQVD